MGERFLSVRGQGLPYPVEDTITTLVSTVQLLESEIAALKAQLAKATAAPPPLSEAQLRQASQALTATGSAPLKVTGLPSALGVL